MLHNTGPYGPNEAPVNMGAPVNMTPMGSHMNIAHNINNLSKIAHQSVPAPSGHYNLPEYAHYNHSPITMPPQMTQFPNYQQLGFQQSYVSQNANNTNDLPYPNSMFPMNLNIQNEQNANVVNYAYDKRVIESVRQDNYIEQNARKIPLNIPQIPNKVYNKHTGGNNDFLHNNMYEETHHNLDLSMKSQEKLQINSTRRKNIENTVKLIENILIQSSTKPREVQSSTKPREVPAMIPIGQNNTVITHAMKPSDMTIMKVKETVLKKNQEVNTVKLPESPADLTKESNSGKEEQSQEKIDAAEEHVTEYDTDNEQNNTETDILSDDEEVKPIAITQHFIREDAAEAETEANTDSSIVIKVEKATWADSECYNPFLKDSHGFERDGQMNYRIIEGDVSVEQAYSCFRNDIKPEGVFECPHCALLLKHPKRFLIHTKWHTFGLTHIKRMEIAKIREQRRFERKEQRVIERMNSKDVTDMKVDGKTFPCKDCDKVFSAKGSLKNHRQRTHPTRIRECRICHKTISSWTDLRAHLSTHTAESGPGFQCSECPKRFKYAHSLAKHSDTHLEKVHACKDCPKKFGSQALLKMHMKTHERVLRGATFRCTYCAKGFFESYSLQVHERTHRNERPYTCDICNTSYGTNSSLKRHVKVSHNTNKPYQCTVCKRNFSTESIRDKHELRLHGKPEDFKFPCKQCSHKYLKLKDLQKHIYKMHPKGKRKKKSEGEEEEASESE